MCIMVYNGDIIVYNWKLVGQQHDMVNEQYDMYIYINTYIYSMYISRIYDGSIVGR